MNKNGRAEFLEQDLDRKSAHANRRILTLNFTLTVFTLACPEDPRKKETRWPLDDSSADSWNAHPKLLV